MSQVDSSYINQLILIALKQAPLPHQVIVNEIADKLDEPQEECYPGHSLYIRVSNQEASLQGSGYIINDKDLKRWKILPKGEEELNRNMSIVNSTAIFKYFCKELQLEPYKKTKGNVPIDYLCTNKKKEFVIIEINPEDRDTNFTQRIKEKIELVKKHYATKNEIVHGIIIKDSTKNPIPKPQTLENHIQIINYNVEIIITDNQTKSPNNEIQPIDENALSNYLIEHLDKFNENLQINENYHPREYRITGRRSIDIFCKDTNENLVVIENKIYPKTEYHVVGQILYYLSQVEKNLPQKIVRGIILIPNNNDKDKTDTINGALSCYHCNDKDKKEKIKLKFYSLILNHNKLNLFQ